jgi:putative component of toxin-antitoxin plasmid stabilization module
VRQLTELSYKSIILCGGDKSTQQEDIEKAKQLAREEEEEDNENE